MNHLRLIIILLSVSASTSAAAFAGTRQVFSTADILVGHHPRSTTNTQPIAATSNPFKGQHGTSLHASLAEGVVGLSKSAAVTSFVSSVISYTRRNSNILFLLLAATALFSKRSNPQAVLWPGTEFDDKETPLPEGSYGCPFIGVNFYGGTREYGPFAGLAKLSKRFGNVFKLYSFGLPLVSVTGVDNIKALLKNEFKPDGLGTFMMGNQNGGPMFGEESILYENDSAKHSLLRKLAGSAMTPAAIGEALPMIEEAANDQIRKMLEGDTVQMEEIFSDYTLDIAWKQILGLDLKEDEIPKFHSAVKDWTEGVMDPWLLLPFRVPGLMWLTRVGRARTYLVAKVEEKLAQLERDGPDSSALSKLYFATDENDGAKLTRTQVIHNALILIFAGSETTATTLTCASLILALHPDVWQKIKDEQQQVVAEFGEELTQKSLEKCTYLECVIKETLRLKPLEASELRKVEKTVFVDGKQIPKGWYAIPNIKQTHVTDPAVFAEDESHMDIKQGFKPERWLSDETKPSAWMPFGDGRRRCLGERLAFAEMTVFLSLLSRKANYELNNSSDEITWKTSSIMGRPSDGVEVRASRA